MVASQRWRAMDSETAAALKVIVGSMEYWTEGKEVNMYFNHLSLFFV